MIDQLLSLISNSEESTKSTPPPAPFEGQGIFQSIGMFYPVAQILMKGKMQNLELGDITQAAIMYLQHADKDEGLTAAMDSLSMKAMTRQQEKLLIDVENLKKKLELEPTTDNSNELEKKQELLKKKSEKINMIKKLGKRGIFAKLFNNSQLKILTAAIYMAASICTAPGNPCMKLFSELTSKLGRRTADDVVVRNRSETTTDSSENNYQYKEDKRNNLNSPNRSKESELFTGFFSTEVPYKTTEGQVKDHDRIQEPQGAVSTIMPVSIKSTFDTPKKQNVFQNLESYPGKIETSAKRIQDLHNLPSPARHPSARISEKNSSISYSMPTLEEDSSQSYQATSSSKLQSPFQTQPEKQTSLYSFNTIPTSQSQAVPGIPAKRVSPQAIPETRYYIPQKPSYSPEVLQPLTEAAIP